LNEREIVVLRKLSLKRERERERAVCSLLVQETLNEFKGMRNVKSQVIHSILLQRDERQGRE